MALRHARPLLRRGGRSCRSLSAVPLPPEWCKLAEEDLKGKPVTSLIRRSPEGIDIKPIYTAEDVKVRCGDDHDRRVAAARSARGDTRDSCLPLPPFLVHRFP
jgi:hypothetical protein